MKALAFAAPIGALPVMTGSALLFGGFLYVFLGAAPITGIASLHEALGLGWLITLNDFCTLGHMGLYGFLTFGLCLICRNAEHRFPIAASLIVLGIGIEFLQEAFFGRQFQLADMAANTAGIVVAILVLSIREKRTSR